MKIPCFLFLLQSSSVAFGFINSANNQGISNPSRVASKLFSAPEILEEEGSWQAYLDEETTGLIYYFNSETGESLWEPPTDSFPEVRLPRKKQRLADDLRREYRRSIEVDEETETNDSNWFSGIFDRAPAPAEQVEEDTFVGKIEEPTDVPPSSSWFGGIAAGIQKESPAEETEEVIGGESETADTKKDWLGGLFGDATPKEEKAEKKTPVVEENEDSPKARGILDSFTAKKQSTETPVVKERKVITEPGKKKDPKIGGNVKKAITVGNKLETPTVEITSEPIKIDVASNILPHPAKVRWGGEDAVFVKGRSFGVFDGVSGANKLDGVPLYSRTLANEMKKKVGNDGLSVSEMTKYLTEAADVADAFATGASTAVVASIGENGFLQALNLGDSCCMVIRDGKVAAKTREISHYWECPYQLSDDSPDRPKDGTKLNVELTPGDIILMGSDGVFDNVDDDMILETVAKTPAKASQIAKKICTVSRKQSQDKESVTPYSKQAQRRGDPNYKFGIGGKVDDIGCVVVVCK